MVPEPEGQVEEEGAHEERAREACAQRPPCDVLRGAHPRRGAETQGAGEAAEEAAEVAGASATQAGRQGRQRGPGHAQERVGDSTGQ